MRDKSYIYLVSQSHNSGYDTFDSFVVIADDEEQARNTHPRGGGLKDDYFGSDSWCPLSFKHEIDVRLIGVTHKQELEIICTSFKAG